MCSPPAVLIAATAKFALSARAPPSSLDLQIPFISTSISMKKYVTAGVLLVLIALLAWFVWIETKVLLITLALLAVALVALYFVLKKM